MSRKVWIQEILIESFGSARREIIGDLGPGLTIIFGPNEAGKTTTLEFVRSAFFGFKKISGSANIYESPDGALRRGRLTIGCPGHGSIRVERIEKRGIREGLLIVSDEQGRPLDPSILAVFRAGLDRNVYENLFAFDLDAMSRLDQRTLRGKIAAAALGSLRINPIEVQNNLNERLNRLSHRTAGNGDSLSALQEQLKAVDRQIKVLSEQPARYSKLKEELGLVNSERLKLISDAKALEERLNAIQTTMRCEHDWKRLLALEKELATLQDGSAFPADGLIRLEKAIEKRREAAEGLLELEHSLRRLRQEEATLCPDLVYFRYGEKIRSIHREALIQEKVRSEIHRLESKLCRSREILENEISSLGPGWNLERIVAIDVSIAFEKEIRQFSISWRANRDRIDRLKACLREIEERNGRLLAKLTADKEELRILVPRCAGYLDPQALQRLEEWKSHFTKTSQLEERISEKRVRIEDLISRRQEIEARCAGLAEQNKPLFDPVLFWGLIALVFASGSTMMYAAWTSSGPAAYLLLLFGAAMLLCVPIFGRTKIMAERKRTRKSSSERETLNDLKERVTREIAKAEDERRRLLKQMETSRREREQIASEVLGDTAAQHNSILEAQRRSAAAEEPMRSRRLLEAALRSESSQFALEDARRAEMMREIQEEQKACERLNEVWQATVARSRLEPGLDPDASLTLMLRVRELKTAASRVSDEETALTQMKLEVEAFSAKVRLLGSEMNRNASPQVGPLEQIEAWLNSESAAKDILTRKEALARIISDQEARLGVLKAKERRAVEELNALMKAAGTGNEEAFRQKASINEQYNLCKRDRTGLLVRIMTYPGMRDEGEVRAFMESQDWDDNRRLELESASQIETLKERSEYLTDRKGRLEKEIETLEADETAEMLLSQREELRARLNQLSEQWVCLKTASILLEDAIRAYETEKQPAVLARGSRIFSEITGNTFRKILFPLGKDMQAERSDGSTVGEELLSRGTLEQLYLALRLAHLDVYHRQDPVPVLMDDVLVNFDNDRGRRTAESLVKFSEESGTQILFFTCHSRTEDLFPQKIKRIHLQLSSIREATA